MLKFFVRFYLGLVAALVLSLTTAALVLDRQYEKILAQENLWLAGALNELVQSRLQTLEPGRWPEALLAYSGQYPFHIAVQPRDEMPVALRQTLTQEGVAIRMDVDLFDEDIALYFPLNGYPDLALHYQGNDQLYAHYNWLLLGLMLALLVGIGLSVWWLGRPLGRHIDQLAEVSRDIGAGQLSARADEQAPAPLGKLARDLNTMAQQLDQLMQEQEAMTGAVSHELRTPIANLRFALDMTRAAENMDQLRQQVLEMDGDIDALDDLVDELLTYARLRHSSEQVTKQHLPLRPLLQALIDKLGPQQPGLHYQLECDPKAQLLANERDLQRAVSNLLRNAQRYASTQVVIRVQTHPASLTLTVEDDGPGIPPAERQRVWLPFTRLDESRTRASGGFGLGLAIVRRIVQQHGGEARVDTGALGGAAFILRFVL